MWEVWLWKPDYLHTMQIFFHGRHLKNQLKIARPIYGGRTTLSIRTYELSLWFTSGGNLELTQFCWEQVLTSSSFPLLLVTRCLTQGVSGLIPDCALIKVIEMASSESPVCNFCRQTYVRNKYFFLHKYWLPLATVNNLRPVKSAMLLHQMQTTLYEDRILASSNVCDRS